MDCFTFTPEQLGEMFDVLFILVFTAVLAAFFVWEAFGYLLRRLCVMLRVKHIKRLRNNPQN